MTRCRERPPRTAPRPARGSGAKPPPAERRSAAYDDAYLDGLFTYCLSIMCEHDAATAALGEALAQAERRHERGRRPDEPALSRSWLYALARWACLRRLAIRDEAVAAAGPRAAGEDARRRRRELAALAWLEAAGTTPEQREALELAVRHQLSAREIARVLRLPAPAVGTLLADGAREVERTRAALAAVSAAGCPAAAALAGDDRRLLLGPGLRRELVRHVDDCPTCRLIARRALAAPGPVGAGSGGSSRLAVLPAPRPAVHAARLAVRRARAQHAPRYDRSGFPLAEKDRAARRERLRGRAFTTTVVATVLAAPALALWAAYRDAPATGEAARSDGPAATSGDDALGEDEEYAFENAGRPRPDGGQQGEEGQGGGEEPDGRAESEPTEDPADGARDPAGAGREGEGRPDGERAGSAGAGGGGANAERPPPAPGRLTAEAARTDQGTRITMTVSGESPVDWTAATDANWLVLSQTSGTLSPGESAVIEVTVDRSLEPAGPWQGRITIGPSAAVVTIEGSGPEPEPSEPPPSDPEPTDPPPGGGAPDPQPNLETAAEVAEVSRAPGG